MNNLNQKCLKIGAFIILSFLIFSCANIKNQTEEIVKKAIGVDAHNHMDVPFDYEKFKTQSYDLKGEMKKSGLSAICMTFCVDRPNLDSIGEAYNRFILSLDEMDIMLENNNIKRALNYSDIEKAHKENQPIVVQSVEGGHFIEDKIERIEIAYNRGLRHLGLLHDNQSFVPLGDIYTNSPQFGGLTEMGIKVVKECNRLGILVDLTHCSNNTIDDALEVSTKPIIISHTGLNTQLGTNKKMAKMMMPRLISKEQAKKVSDAGGVIGVWTHLADSPLEYAKNIKAMVDVVGIDHVCIGTDTKMATSINSNEKFGKNTNQSWKTDNNEGFFYTVSKAMIEIGFTEDEIIKIGGGNYWRIFNEATKK
tara:strand:- start:8 stop:1102 length:1095 start_codon:yes stop_codon:yes gene_type:complete